MSFSRICLVKLCRFLWFFSFFSVFPLLVWAEEGLNCGLVMTILWDARKESGEKTFGSDGN